MDEELYDVILKVPSNGIHSPYNLHAFKLIRNIFPITCEMCLNIIYPLTLSVICVRCNCYSHRTCTKCNHNKCKKFLLSPNRLSNSHINNLNNNNHNNNNSNNNNNYKNNDNNNNDNSNIMTWGVTGNVIETTENNKQVIQVVPPIVQTTNKLLGKLGILAQGPYPKPGSENCLWRKALREIASNFNIMRIGSLSNNTHHNQLHQQQYLIARMTQSLLRDINSFPGRVAYELRNLYLSLTFHHDKDYLLHGREMLDNIACSIFTILPTDINQELYLRLVITIVDWYVLKEHDGSIYDILWNSARRLSQTMDQILVEKLYEQSSIYSDPNITLSVPNYDDIHQKLSLIPCEYSGMDKLKRLVQVLKYISTPTTIKPTKESELNCEEKNNTSNTKDTLNQYDDQRELIQDMNVDADLLMKRFTEILGYYTLKYEVYWYAECIFIEYLCTETTWMNDAEGYAFVTLQQALRILCPNAAIVSAAHNEVEIRNDNIPDCIDSKVDKLKIDNSLNIAINSE